MQNYNRILASLLLTVSTIVFFKTPGLAGDCETDNQKDSGLMVTDVTLARPVGTVATVAGFAFFVISSPFSALGGNSQEAWNSLVVSPANYTFKRPLGHFDCERPPYKK
jgi:hypothetical protein